MMKIVIGLTTAIVVAALGYFGFTFYAQHRAATEIEATFERVRLAGNKASHGTVSYDPWKHTLTIADIAFETAATQLPTTIKIASLTASGIGQPGPDQFSVDNVEVTDAEMSVAIVSGNTQLQYFYKAPRLTVADCSGPLRAEHLPAGASKLDAYRHALAQFARVTASSVTIPSVAITAKLNSAALTAGDMTYTGIEVEHIKDGKIATAKVDKGTIAYTAEVAGKSTNFNGTFANLVVLDLDARAAAALLVPPEAGDIEFHQLYRQISLDDYDVRSPPTLHMQFGHVELDDIAVQPSRLQLPALLAALPKPGMTPSPAEAQAMMEKMAGMYEGLHLGDFTVNGITIDTLQSPVKLGALHFNMDGGKSDLVLEGLDARTPQGPLKAGRLALKALNLVNFMRLSATMTPGQKPPAEQALALFQLVQGAEVKDLVAPSKQANKPLSIESLDIHWGEFIGPIPTQAHLIAKADVPISASDAKLQPLLAAGIQSTKIDADLGLAWTEASGDFALEPATLEIAGLAKAQARVTLANVPRALFAEPQKLATTAAQIGTGTIELTLHDLGGVDLVVDQYARGQQLSHDAARSAILEAIKTNGAQVAGTNPDATAAVEAIGHFVETPQQTLVIKLTPIGKLPAVQLFQLLKSDPMAALAQFKIEASTGL